MNTVIKRFLLKSFSPVYQRKHFLSLPVQELGAESKACLRMKPSFKRKWFSTEQVAIWDSWLHDVLDARSLHAFKRKLEKFLERILLSVGYVHAVNHVWHRKLLRLEE